MVLENCFCPDRFFVLIGFCLENQRGGLAGGAPGGGVGKIAIEGPLAKGVGNRSMWEWGKFCEGRRLGGHTLAKSCGKIERKVEKARKMVEVTAGRALWEKCREAIEPVRGGGQTNIIRSPL